MILKTAQIILESKEKKDKVEKLIEENINDLDVIRIAEEELNKSKLLDFPKQEKNKIDFKSIKEAFKWEKN